MFNLTYLWVHMDIKLVIKIKMQVHVHIDCNNLHRHFSRVTNLPGSLFPLLLHDASKSYFPFSNPANGQITVFSVSIKIIFFHILIKPISIQRLE